MGVLTSQGVPHVQTSRKVCQMKERQKQEERTKMANMENSQSEDIALFPWSFQRKTRFFKTGDAFFEEGNNACFQRSKHIVQDAEIDDLLACFSNVNMKEEEPLLFCDVKGCTETFFTVKAYELHQSSVHKFICSFCRRNFPSNYLLELHITENHDTLVATRMQRGEAAYVCIVETCDIKFKNHSERVKHLIEFHKYPSDFRFTKKRRTKTPKQECKTLGLTASETTPALQHDAPMDDKYQGIQLGVEDEKNCAASVEVDMENKANAKIEVKQKNIPKTISFGRGNSRSFQTRRGQNKKTKTNKD